MIEFIYVIKKDSLLPFQNSIDLVFQACDRSILKHPKRSYISIKKLRYIASQVNQPNFFFILCELKK